MKANHFKNSKTWFIWFIVCVGLLLVGCEKQPTPPANASGGQAQADLAAPSATEAKPPPIKDAETHFNAGLKLIKAEKSEEAIAEFDKAIKLDSTMAVAYYQRGIAYGNLGQDEKALADFKKALELEPNPADHGELYLNLGLSYAKTGDQEKAIEFWTKAIKAGQNSAQIYLDRGKAYFNLKKYQESIADCTKALERDPKLARAYALRGKNKALLGNFKEAIPDLTQAVELDPTLDEALFNRAVSRVKMGTMDWTPIIEDFGTVLKISKNPQLRQQAQQQLEDIYKTAPSPLREKAAAALGLTANDAASGDYQTYVHDMDCSGYNEKLKLQTFSVLYPKGFVISTCEKKTDNYVVFELNPDKTKQDSDFALVFGYFYLDAPAAKLKSTYLKDGEKLLDTFGPQLASQLKAVETSDKPLVFEEIPFYRRDYMGKPADGITRLARLVIIPNFDHDGQGLFFMAIKKVQSTAKEEFPEFDTLTQKIIGSVDFSPDKATTPAGSSNSPEAVLQAIFDAAKNQDFANLAGLCDPTGKNEADTALICEITATHAKKDSFVQVFAKGKINGKAVIKGDQAQQPFLYGPAGDKKATMNLILRDGQWYLLGF
jgi:tetratricopeptide (TPR) repeat protein